MATEDIELTWRLLLAGWETVYEPRALVVMQVPPSLRALWAQRKRWTRGQGEVIRVHFREVFHWRNRRMGMLVMESLISLIWIITLVASLIIAALGVRPGGEDVFGFALAWGIAGAALGDDRAGARPREQRVVWDIPRSSWTPKWRRAIPAEGPIPHTLCGACLRRG